jgi:hypothetical protein
VPQSFHQFFHFAARVFVCSYIFLGTSPGGIGAQVVSIIGTGVRGEWWQPRVWQESWRRELKRAFGILVVVWFFVAVGCLVTTSYEDHQNLAARLRALANEKDAVKAGLRTRDDTIRQLQAQKNCAPMPRGSLSYGTWRILPTDETTLRNALRKSGLTKETPLWISVVRGDDAQALDIANQLSVTVQEAGFNRPGVTTHGPVWYGLPFHGVVVRVRTKSPGTPEIALGVRDAFRTIMPAGIDVMQQGDAEEDSIQILVGDRP